MAERRRTRRVGWALGAAAAITACAPGAVTDVSPATEPDGSASTPDPDASGDPAPARGDASPGPSPGDGGPADGGPAYDASTDAAADTSADAGVDASADAGGGLDAGVDASADAGGGLDAGVDASADAGGGLDAGVDTSADAGVDASADASGATACRTAATAWVNAALAPESDHLVLDLEVTPGAPRLDGIVALSAAPGAGYTDYAVLVRFNVDGSIDARDGDTYRALASIPYEAGTTYRIALDVDLPSRSFDLLVTGPDGPATLLADDFAFRTEQALTATLANVGLLGGAGTLEVCGLPPGSSCGDGSCGAAETCASCAADCGECPTACGDGSCGAAETCASCAADCGSCPGDLGDLRVDPARVPEISAPVDRPDTSAWTVVPFTGPLTGEAVSAAIEAAPARSIVALPDGVYTGGIVHRRSEVVVRGNCDDRSRVVWRHSGPPATGLVWDSTDGMLLCGNAWVSLCGARPGEHWSTDVLAARTTWHGPYERGTRTLTVGDTSGYAVGDVVLLESDLLVDADEDPNLDRFRYLAEIAAIGPGTVTLDRSLPITFAAAGASIARIRLQERAGVECMTMEQTDPGDPSLLYRNATVYFSLGWETWLYDVDLGDSYEGWGMLANVGRAIFTGNRFGHQHKSLAGDGMTCDMTSRCVGGADDYAACGGDAECDTGECSNLAHNPCWNKNTMMWGTTYDSAFVNNTVWASIGLQLIRGSARNWVAYNWFAPPRYHPPAEPRRTVFFHGGYSFDNVVEGNVMHGVAELDMIWGTQGPYNTFYRNVAVGGWGRFQTESQLYGADTTTRLSKYTSFILNLANELRHSVVASRGLDARSDFMHVERNVYRGALVVGDATSRGTIASENFHDGSGTGAGPGDWGALRFPSTLNRRVAGSPPFWCRETVSRGGETCDFGARGGVGALWDGTCVLPAEARATGRACTPE